MFIACIVGVWLALTGVASAKLIPNSLFGDHMVLQTSDENGVGAVLSGISNPDETITITFSPATPSGQTKFTGRADDDGYWRLTINEGSSGPFTITLTSDSNIVGFKYEDAYFGDVYLCSGQSNMQFPVHLLANKTDEINNANYPNIRLYNVNAWGNNKPVPPMKWAPNPYTNINGTVPWRLTTPDSVQDFSAVCYVTARKIMEHHTQGRAIGLVESCIGGTPIQAWTPRRGLYKCQMNPDYPVSDQSDTAQSGWEQPSTLYNQMIAPFNNASFRAVMWYQGEANMDEGFALAYEEYECLFRNLINEWREDFKDVLLPFFFVQISACGSGSEYNWRWNAIRTAQARVEENTVNTGMALAFDRGFHGIHSPWKEDPTSRLMYRILETAFKVKDPKGVRPRVVGACAQQIGGFNGNPTNITSVYFKVDDAQMLTLKGTTSCNQCCNRTAKHSPNAPGVALGIGQFQIATTKSEGEWYDARIELADGGFVLNADTGNITHTKGAMLFSARFEIGPYPQCGVYNENNFPIGPFGPINVSPGCKFSRGKDGYNEKLGPYPQDTRRRRKNHF